ncbi:prepilin-type N-terminal cleavage/methylation domain-containing protein [Elusimicrobium simillimum]|uniref:type IV pilin protein n=1 Tax=Elusimicrobium simillimum TaxID=3143438 RepID=UPI003C6F4126
MKKFQSRRSILDRGITQRRRVAKTNGFTLIELLVVVLIIGILAAIALPQYQAAVIKSRTAAVIPNLKALALAEERYFLTNGSYTNNFADLDIELNSSCSGERCIINNNEYYLNTGGGYVVAYPNGTFATAASTITITLTFDETKQSDLQKNAIACIDRNKAIFTKVCKSLGGKTQVTFNGTGKMWLLQ